MPLVSVVVPTYNSAKFLPETIESILQQDFEDFEIIIIDDNSKDDTREVVNPFLGDNIQYYCLETNHGGPSRARNVGISKAIGKYIALCDSDDIWEPDHLKEAMDFLTKEKEIAMVFTDVRKFDECTGDDLASFLRGYDRFQGIPKRKIAEKCFVIDSVEAFSCLFYENYILTCGVVARKHIFNEVGLFDESLTNGDDKDMWFRITRKYPIGFLNKIGFRYRVRISSISGRGASLAENRIKVFHKQIETGLPANLKTRCQKMIAQNYYGIGYNFQVLGQMNKARKYYLHSLSASVNLAALKGVLITLAGGRVYSCLKKY